MVYNGDLFSNGLPHTPFRSSSCSS